jgi:2-C-methyl-D-erythritol 4-phosphate cytidylyltransferase
MKTVAILLCAGAGNRMKGKVSDKILAELKGRPVFDYSLKAFEDSGVITSYIVVYRDSTQLNTLQERFNPYTSKQVLWIEGGAERQESVYNALEASPDDTGLVMIHDCARPLVKPEMIHEVHQAALNDNSAVLAHRSIDTMKQVSAGSSLKLAKLENLDRRNLWAMETPQAFSFSLILNAYRKLKAQNIQVTDDTAAVIQLGHPVTLVENRFPNPKITLPEDLALVELMLQQADS